MQYVGSKNRISKELVPIIQSYITDETMGYLEPFVGGANIIDKIKCKNKIGCDIHKELIALLKHTQTDSDDFPELISEEEYKQVKDNKDKFPSWYVGLVGFCATFGNKYFGGYARNARGDNSGRRSATAIKNLKNQAVNIQDIKFRNIKFQDLPLDKIKGYVIYCDIPYKGTTKYKTNEFPYEEFYSWIKAASTYNTVLISEYNMPEEFTCIWSKEVKTLLDSNRVAGDESNIRVEKLFTYNKNI